LIFAVAKNYLFVWVQTDLANLQKKKDEEKALKELKAKASSKGAFGGAGLKKSGGSGKK
jgi:hypothetical protein